MNEQHRTYQSETYEVTDAWRKLFWELTSVPSSPNLTQGNGNTVTLDGDYLKLEITSTNKYLGFQSNYSHFSVDDVKGKTLNWRMEVVTDGTWSMDIIENAGSGYQSVAHKVLSDGVNTFDDPFILSANATTVLFRLTSTSTSGVLKTKNWVIYESG